MKTGRYSFSQLLDNEFVDCIIIPEMQRDYVWSADNVDGLFNSIEANFLRKTKLQLSISNNGEIIDDASRNHLTKEYERLIFNTRIGFIYAYYDASDSRVLYLIDGQQRITTLFLVLLGIYTKCGKDYCKEFREKYFLNKMPRLDYRVRENAHNYLVDFIDFVLECPDGDFATESGHFYADYSFDPTIRAIQNNYNRIRERLNSLNGDIFELLDYVENFIEFNYFDTGLSSQGERLYLYMNSRGEGLSLQEDIKPVIISRCKIDEKIEGGRKWEKWQNFFWIHRKESQNSDNGFWGFLKLSVILHQAHFDFSKWEGYKSETDHPELQSQKDIREAFINKKYITEQHRWVHRYIIETPEFDIHWLENCFAAYFKLSKIYDESVKKTTYPHAMLRIANWRSVESFDTIHYVVICGILEMLIKQPEISEEDLYRFGMYLLNRSYDSNNSKVPATATRRAIDLAAAMSKVGMQDIRKLGNNRDITTGNEHMDCTESILWKRIGAKEWEELFWNLTANQEFNSFFNGCHDVLIKLSDEKNDYTVAKINESNERFIQKFFNQRNSKSLRQELLAYGDISIRGGNNTWNLENEMERWKLPATEEWLDFFKDEKNLAIVRRFLNDEQKLPDGWRIALGNSVEYIGNYRYLWQTDDDAVMPNIVLLKAIQAKENLSRSLPSYLLAKVIDGWNWGGNHRYANLDFIIENGLFKTVNPGEGTYAFDFIFHWDSKKSYWEIELTKRADKDFSDEEIKALKDDWENTSKPTKLHLKQRFEETEGYTPEGTLKSIRNIQDWLESIKRTLGEKLIFPTIRPF